MQFNQALEVKVKVHGEEHPSTDNTHNTIANVLDDKGEYNDALVQYKRSLEVRVKVLGEEYLDTANT